MSSKIAVFFDKYQLIFLIAAIIDFFLFKGTIFSGVLFFYYLLNLIVSYVKKRNVKKIAIKFIISFFSIILISFLGDIWNNEIKEKTVIYYNQSNLKSGYEQKEVIAFNTSRLATLYFENNNKTVSIILFNFKKVTYDNENKWREL